MMLDCLMEVTSYSGVSPQVKRILKLDGQSKYLTIPKLMLHRVNVRTTLKLNSNEAHMKLIQSEYESFKIELCGMTLTSVWRSFNPHNLELALISFEDRKECFLNYLERILNDGIAKLADRDEFLSGSTQQQIAILNLAFPKSQTEMESDAFDGFWFFTEECPCAIVWIDENGHEVWT